MEEIKQVETKEAQDIEALMEQARTLSKACFREGMNCSECVMRSFMEMHDTGLPDESIAMASGFGVGMENSRSLCGALAGGVLVLGMLFGRDKPGDVKVDRCQKLAGELHDVFVKKHGSAICCALVEGLADGSPEREERCALYCADAAAMLGTIVEREWFSGACCQIGGH